MSAKASASDDPSAVEYTQTDRVTLKNWNVSCKLQQNQPHVIRLQSFACSSECDKISSSTIFRVKYTVMLGLSYIYFILSYVYVIILYGKASFRQIRAIWLVLFQSGFCSMYPSRVFLFWSKAGKFKICDQNSEKKMWILSFSIAKLPEKAKKIEILRRFQRWMKKKNILWASSELSWTSGTFDSETKTVITESQEAIDDFINQQKSANTNKKKATDINTLLHYFEANGTLWKMRKLKAYLRPSLTTFHDFLSKFVWMHGGKTEKNKS